MGQGASPDEMNMSAVTRYLAGVGVALLVFVAFSPYASVQGMAGPNVVILLRLTGDGRADPQIRSCLAYRLSRMPDIEIGTASTVGIRFVVDIMTAKPAPENISASLVVVETFPIEQFRTRFKAGEDSNALLTSIRQYTLLRLHELVLGRSQQSLCARIATDIADKVLSKEYTERND
jgi:hypothetical protein